MQRLNQFITTRSTLASQWIGARTTVYTAGFTIILTGWAIAWGTRSIREATAFSTFVHRQRYDFGIR